MNPCKEKLENGMLCPNLAYEAQEYCPYHLASQVADEKKKLINAGKWIGGGVTIFGFGKVTITGIEKLANTGMGKEAITVIGKIAKFVISKKL